MTPARSATSAPVPPTDGSLSTIARIRSKRGCTYVRSSIAPPSLSPRIAAKIRWGTADSQTGALASYNVKQVSTNTP